MKSQHKVDATVLQDVKKARSLIKDVLEREHTVPLFVRLAIHDAFAYDVAKNTFGANASIRTQKELSHKGNEGLQNAVESLARIKAQLSVLSFADLFQLAGIVAVEQAGGPMVKFVPGRKDAWTFPPQAAYLSPNLGGNPLEDFLEWSLRTGLPLQSCVALLGAHSIARWWPESDGSYSLPHNTLPNPTFSNAYFRLLVAGDLPQDDWLLADPSIKQAVTNFSEDEDLFNQEYAAAHEQLSLLGTKLTAATVTVTNDDAKGAVAGASMATAEYAQYLLAAGACIALSGLVGYGLWKRRRRRLAKLL